MLKVINTTVPKNNPFHQYYPLTTFGVGFYHPPGFTETMEGIISPPSLSFSSTISIHASLDCVTDNSSLTYLTFCLTVVFEFTLLMFLDDAALMNASYKSSINKLSMYYYYLTCMNFPLSRVMLHNTMLIQLFWSQRRGTTMNDTCNSTMSPSWKVWGPVSFFVIIYKNYNCRWWLPCLSCAIFAHFVVVDSVFLSVDICRAGHFSEVALGVHFMGQQTFLAFITSHSERKVAVGCVNGCESVLLGKASFILKLGTNGSFEYRLDSSHVWCKFFKRLVPITCNSCALPEEFWVVTVHPAFWSVWVLFLVIGHGLPNLVQEWR